MSSSTSGIGAAAAPGVAIEDETSATSAAVKGPALVKNGVKKIIASSEDEEEEEEEEEEEPLQMISSTAAARICESCNTRTARWWCDADQAFFCDPCDGTVHSANAFSYRHERLRVFASKNTPAPHLHFDRPPPPPPPPQQDPPDSRRRLHESADPDPDPRPGKRKSHTFPAAGDVQDPAKAPRRADSAAPIHGGGALDSEEGLLLDLFLQEDGEHDGGEEHENACASPPSPATCGDLNELLGGRWFESGDDEARFKSAIRSSKHASLPPVGVDDGDSFTVSTGPSPPLAQQQYQRQYKQQEEILLGDIPEEALLKLRLNQEEIRSIWLRPMFLGQLGSGGGARFKPGPCENNVNSSSSSSSRSSGLGRSTGSSSSVSAGPRVHRAIKRLHSSSSGRRKGGPSQPLPREASHSPLLQENPV